jgi:hypothetical protein
MMYSSRQFVAKQATVMNGRPCSRYLLTKSFMFPSAASFLIAIAIPKYSEGLLLLGIPIRKYQTLWSTQGRRTLRGDSESPDAVL